MERIAPLVFGRTLPSRSQLLKSTQILAIGVVQFLSPICECNGDFMTPGLSSLFRSCLRGFSQEGLNISSQRDFHFRLRLFKAARLNSDGRFFAAATPTVICEPELAIDTKKWCH